MAKRHTNKEGRPAVRIKLTSIDGAVLAYELVANDPRYPELIKAATEAFLAELDEVQ